MLASRWVENLLNFIYTRRDYRVTMMWWSPYFKAEMVNLEVISCRTKLRKYGFLICDKSERHSAFSAHRELSRMVKQLLRCWSGWWVNKFSYSEGLSIFNGDIHCAICIRTSEFDGDGSSVTIIKEFDFYCVYYDVFIVGFRRCGGMCIS